MPEPARLGLRQDCGRGGDAAQGSALHETQLLAENVGVLAGETAVGADFAGGDAITVAKPGGLEAARHDGKQRSAAHIVWVKIPEALQYAAGSGLADWSDESRVTPRESRFWAQK